MTENSKALTLKFGERTEVEELSQRILDFLPGARDLPREGRLALAQIAVMHDLDPFTGEVWAIPEKNRDTGQVVGFRLMIGIAGWRAHAHRTGEFDGRSLQPCSAEERKWMGAGPNDIAMKCIIARRKPGRQAMVFDGFGLYRQGEKTKMNPLQCARYRAEREAMKAAFPISLKSSPDAHVQVIDEESGEVIEGQVFNPQPVATPVETSAKGDEEKYFGPPAQPAIATREQSTPEPVGASVGAQGAAPTAEGVFWCEWCNDKPSVPGVPCASCQQLGAPQEARTARAVEAVGAQSAAPNTAPAQPSGAKRKPAVIKTRAWFDLIKPLADRFPKYRTKDGTPNSVHLAMAASAEGYTEITDLNLAQVIQSVQDRAHQDAQADLELLHTTEAVVTV